MEITVRIFQSSGTAAATTAAAAAAAEACTKLRYENAKPLNGRCERTKRVLVILCARRRFCDANIVIDRANSVRVAADFFANRKG